MFDPATDTRTTDYRQHSYRLIKVYDDAARKRERMYALNKKLREQLGIKEG